MHLKNRILLHNYMHIYIKLVKSFFSQDNDSIFIIIFLLIKKMFCLIKNENEGN